MAEIHWDTFQVDTIRAGIQVDRLLEEYLEWVRGGEWEAEEIVESAGNKDDGNDNHENPVQFVNERS